jgi:Protein of unknown function (DUF3768)
MPPPDEARAAERTARIRALNDAFRTAADPIETLYARGQLMMTRGVAALGAAFVDRALAAVRAFDRFTEHDDPHGEHDFGAFDLDGKRLFWKIDTYDNALEYGSPDSADPAVTKRVLTVMLREEY